MSAPSTSSRERTEPAFGFQRMPHDEGSGQRRSCFGGSCVGCERWCSAQRSVCVTTSADANPKRMTAPPPILSPSTFASVSGNCRPCALYLYGSDSREV
ncbi:hypothetical protein MTO96_049805 [Rhipicephalus appendiculatus]